MHFAGAQATYARRVSILHYGPAGFDVFPRFAAWLARIGGNALIAIGSGAVHTWIADALGDRRNPRSAAASNNIALLTETVKTTPSPQAYNTRGAVLAQAGKTEAALSIQQGDQPRSQLPVTAIRRPRPCVSSRFPGGCGCSLPASEAEIQAAALACPTRGAERRSRSSIRVVRPPPVSPRRCALSLWQPRLYIRLGASSKPDPVTQSPKTVRGQPAERVNADRRRRAVQHLPWIISRVGECLTVIGIEAIALLNRQAPLRFPACASTAARFVGLRIVGVVLDGLGEQSNVVRGGGRKKTAAVSSDRPRRQRSQRDRTAPATMAINAVAADAREPSRKALAKTSKPGCHNGKCHAPTRYW